MQESISSVYEETVRQAWASYPVILSHEQPCPLLGCQSQESKYSELLSEIVNWRHCLSTPEEELKILRKKTRTGRPCGDESFIDKVEKLTGRVLSLQKPGSKKKE